MKQDKFLILGVMILIFGINLVNAAQFYGVWNTQNIYDTLNNSVINWSLWTNTTTGTFTTATVIENANYLSAKLFLSGTTATQTLSTTSFPYINSIENVTIKVDLYTEAQGIVDTPYSRLSIFGNTILQLDNAGSTTKKDSSIWTLIRNNTKFEVYNDGVWNKTITPSGNVILVEGYASMAPANGATSAENISYFYYVYNNLSMNITLNKPDSNSIKISNNNITFNISTNLSVNDLSNVTLYINGILNETKNITGTLNLTTFTKTMLIGNYSWKVYVCDSYNNCKYSETRLFNVSDVVFNSITYNPITSSGTTESFSTNVTYNTGIYNSITSYLNYNNTNYSLTSSSVVAGNNIFNSNILIPTVSLATIKNFSWIVILTNSSGDFYYNSVLNNQTINVIGIDNCTTFTQQLFNFTMIDEDSLVPINGTIEYLIKLYNKNSNLLVSSYNNSISYKTTTSSMICVGTLSSNYTLEYTIRHYGNSSYFKKTRTTQGMEISSTTPIQNMVLYNLLQSSGFSFNIIVVGNILTSNGNSDLLVEAQREYISQNTFNLVESSVTDNDGKTLLNLVPQSENYNFIVSYNGAVLGTFNNMKVQCQNPSIGQCSVTLNLGQATTKFPDYSSNGNISYVYTLDRTNNILYLNYNSLNGLTHSIRMTLTKADGYGNTTICISDSVGTSGTLQCNIPTQYQNTSFFSTLRADGSFVGNKFFTLGVTYQDMNLYGADILIELLMYSTLVMLMLASPILIVIGSFLGLFFGVLLIFLSSGSLASIIAAVIYFFVATVIVIIQLSRRLL